MSPRTPNLQICAFLILRTLVSSFSKLLPHYYSCRSIREHFAESRLKIDLKFIVVWFVTLFHNQIVPPLNTSFFSSRYAIFINSILGEVKQVGRRAIQIQCDWITKWMGIVDLLVHSIEQTPLWSEENIWFTCFLQIESIISLSHLTTNILSSTRCS